MLPFAYCPALIPLLVPFKSAGIPFSSNGQATAPIAAPVRADSPISSNVASLPLFIIGVRPPKAPPYTAPRPAVAARLVPLGAILPTQGIRAVPAICPAISPNFAAPLRDVKSLIPFIVSFV